MAKTMTLDEIRKKREAMELELNTLKAQEQAETDRELRELAEKLITAVKILYPSSGWKFFPEGDQWGGFKVKVVREATGTLGKKSRTVIVINAKGERAEYDSCKAACDALRIDTHKGSCKATLVRHGYTVEYVQKGEGEGEGKTTPATIAE